MSKAVNCNYSSALDQRRSNKQTSTDHQKPHGHPTPIPRVALLRPPRPPPPKNMTKRRQQMTRHAPRVQAERLLTPQHKIAPRYGHVIVPSPPKPEATPDPLTSPLHGHEPLSTPGPRASTPLPPPVPPPYEREPELLPFHSLDTSTPISVPSR
ncbi:hypothetical protein KC19_5G185900, partial [Ceratodon purpureus]